MISTYSHSDFQVTVVGGGPVGLFLGCCLHQAGISCCVLEKRNAPVTYSRSIGIHPVALELFEKMDMADESIKSGIKITKGFAFWGAQKIGILSFAACPPPYRFILTLPQYKTERLLSKHLNRMNPAILQRNCEVTGLEENSYGTSLTISQNGQQKTITSQYVAGCDGMNSFVRKNASISFTGKTYKDTYIMGDFSDNTDFRMDAAIFLSRGGLIESFPLNDKKRRWVVKTDHYIQEVKRSDIEERLNQRIDFQLNEVENYMLSSFRVFYKKAGTLAKGRTILAGDAAHVVSPIGGQGMNLGWLDAYDLAQCFHQIFMSEGNPQKILQAYSHRRLAVAGKAARRAAFNMMLGRKSSFPFFKKALLRAILKKPLSTKMARMFTMRGL